MPVIYDPAYQKDQSNLEFQKWAVLGSAVNQVMQGVVAQREKEQLLKAELENKLALQQAAGQAKMNELQYTEKGKGERAKLRAGAGLLGKFGSQAPPDVQDQFYPEGGAPVIPDLAIGQAKVGLLNQGGEPAGQILGTTEKSPSSAELQNSAANRANAYGIASMHEAGANARQQNSFTFKAALEDARNKEYDRRETAKDTRFIQREDYKAGLKSSEKKSDFATWNQKQDRLVQDKRTLAAENADREYKKQVKLFETKTKLEAATPEGRAKAALAVKTLTDAINQVPAFRAVVDQAVKSKDPEALKSALNGLLTASGPGADAAAKAFGGSLTAPQLEALTDTNVLASLLRNFNPFYKGALRIEAKFNKQNPAAPASPSGDTGVLPANIDVQEVP